MPSWSCVALPRTEPLEHASRLFKRMPSTWAVTTAFASPRLELAEEHDREGRMDRRVALAVTREQMSPARPSRQRVAVIIPQHRTWSWHQRAISALRQDYDVEVFATARAPPYPSSLKLLLSMERRIFGAYELVERASISAAPWPGPEGDNKDAEFALVINLSEAPITYQRAPVIELKFDGTTDSSRLFATLLARKNPYLSFGLTNSAPPIVASYLCIEDKTVLARGLQLSFSLNYAAL
jgi:hypothetical protein